MGQVAGQCCPDKRSHLLLIGIVAGGVTRWLSCNRTDGTGDRQEAPEKL